MSDTKSVANPSSLGSKAALGSLAKLSANYRAKQNDHRDEDEGSGVNPSEGRENSIDDLLKGVSDGSYTTIDHWQSQILIL